MTKETLAARLKELREAAGLTQEQLAARAGLSKRTYEKIEQGASDTKWIAIEAIADALGISTDRFREEPQEPVSEPARGRPKKKPAADGFVSIALVGSVAAGPGSLEEFHGEFLDVAGLYKGCVAYQVKGRSMIDDHIDDGDYVIVRASPAAENGDIVVVWKEGAGAMIKKMGPRGKLLSRDGSRTTYQLDEDAGDRVLGVLKGVVRKC